VTVESAERIVSTAEGSLSPPRLRRSSWGKQGLSRFVALRLITGIVQVLVAIIVIFILLRLLPADPARTYSGVENPSPAQTAASRHALGLDTSIPSQLWQFLGRLAHGDLGQSWDARSPVSDQIVNALPVTLQVVILAFLVTLLIVLPLGLAAALRPGTEFDSAVRGYSLFAGSQPEFWWGLLFIFVGWYKLGFFPSPLGLLSLSQIAPPTVTHFVLIDALLAGDISAFTDALSHLLLPIITVAFALSGPFLKLTRESALNVVNSEFMIYARAAGASRTVIWRLLMRNSLSPIVTLVGITFAASLGGSVIIETVFSLDGIGRYILTSTQKLDYPAIQGAVVVLTAVALGSYVLIDVLYAVIDPRVRYGRSKS